MSKQQVQLSVGDTVKVIKVFQEDWNDHCLGRTGTVIKTEYGEDVLLDVKVKFDNTPTGRGYWFRHVALKRINTPK